MIHSPYGTLRRMNRQDLFGRTGKGIRHTGRGEGGDDFASSSSPASSPPKFREMQGLFQCVHYLYFIKLRTFLAALQEAEKCRPFSNRLIFRDLQSEVHFSLLYKKLRNADHFPIASLSEIYKTTCISRGLTRDRKMRTFHTLLIIKSLQNNLHFSREHGRWKASIHGICCRCRLCEPLTGHQSFLSCVLE